MVYLCELKSGLQTTANLQLNQQTEVRRLNYECNMRSVTRSVDWVNTKNPKFSIHICKHKKYSRDIVL